MRPVRSEIAASVAAGATARQAAEAFFSRLNSRDLEGVQALAADQARPFLQALVAGLPELKLDIASILADDHRAVVEAVASAAPPPDGGPAPPTVPQAWVFDLAGARIAAVRGIWSGGPLEQALPARPDAAAAPAGRDHGAGATSPAARIALAFVAGLGARDVDGMVDLCDDMAGFSDVGFRLGGRQRVLGGTGRVRGIGKVILTAMVEAFPDLAVAVTGVTDDGTGGVAVETVLAGTQAKPWWSVHCAGRSFTSPYLFLFKINGHHTIDAVTIYSDRAGQNRQLGLTESA